MPVEVPILSPEQIQRLNVWHRMLDAAERHPGAAGVAATEGLVVGLGVASVFSGHPIPLPDLTAIALGINVLGLPASYLAELVNSITYSSGKELFN